jgi:hypothetical protein
MSRYLLAAEADKIQDLIFRSARLREVVGGSQLLKRFCDQVPPLLLEHYEGSKNDLVIHSGGSFRILFDQKEAADDFGENLAEVYRLATGGTLTVAEPVKVNGNFPEASKLAEENLRRAKQRRGGWHSPSHLPYVAFCASCGLGLTVTHRKYHPEDEGDPQYLCQSCLAKAGERAEQRADDLDSFLGRFYRTAVPSGEYDWPGHVKRRELGEKDPVEDVADYDGRRYVAYLVADGNEMGELFSNCKDSEQMRELSRELERAMREALAKPTRKAMELPLSDRKQFIPVVPLILGGDDLFALIPAPWALDFAAQFCREYERQMEHLLRKLELEGEKPTISAAVVICKNKHPHRLAHEAGERCLKEAKRLSKQLAQAPGTQGRFSVVNFEVVLSGGLVPPDEGEKKLRSTLRPYWIADKVPEGWGMPIGRLMDVRKVLEDVEMPRKRLIEFRDLYDQINLPDKDDLDPWRADLEHLLKRIDRNEKQGEAMRGALEQLGGDAKVYWYRVQRWPGSLWYGHGLPDLLKAWDFAQMLASDRRDEKEA